MDDDGIKLTDAEMALSFTVAGDDQFHDELFDAETVAHIVAARVQALTAERDELRGALNDQCDWGNAVADRDAARAELAAANARIAEAEGRGEGRITDVDVCKCGHDRSAHHLYKGKCRPGQQCDCLQMVDTFQRPICFHCGAVGHTIGAHF